MSVAVEIEELAHHLHLVPLLARWHSAQFGHLYAAWDEAAATAEFAAMDEPGRVPTTWVAFDGAGRQAGDVLGSISLIDDDELEGYRETGPWLASLYVVPAARRHGLGRTLVHRVEDEARAMGIARLHLFTDETASWYETLGWRPLANAVANGHAVTVMVKDMDPRAPRRVVASRWSTNPDIATAYSYLRPGGTPADRARLREEVAPRTWFAGEATSVEYPGTMHGAWFEGERAARAVLRVGEAGTAVVVGAGLAGIAAARTLHDNGWTVVTLEAGPTIGGRAGTDHSLGGPVHLGAAWFHGDRGNPVTEWAHRIGTTMQPSTWSRAVTTRAGQGPLPSADRRRLGAIRNHIEQALDEAADTAAEDIALGPVLRRLLEDVPAADRVIVRAWLYSEFENLYAASVDDLSLQQRAEPFSLPGSDLFITGPLDAVAAAVTAGLDVRTGERVSRIEQRDDGARVHPDAGNRYDADAVVVTVPVGALKAGRVDFEPALPEEIVATLDRIGAGRVAKVVARFDTAWWQPVPTFFIASDPPVPLPVWVDFSALAGFPALAAFATGDTAVEVESMSEDELCRVVADVLATARL